MRDDIKCWNFHRLDLQKKRKADILDEMKKWDERAESGLITSEEVDYHDYLLDELHKIDQIDRDILRQKSRIRWAVEGDENSHFFHETIRNNKRKKSLNGLIFNGIWSTDPNMLKREAFDHFKSRFKSNSSLKKVFQNSKFSSLYFFDILKLDANFSLKEIKEVVWSCASSKAPGPDGLNFKFIKRYWDLLSQAKRWMKISYKKLDADLSLKEIKEAVWSCASSKAPGPDGLNFNFIKRYWDVLEADFINGIKHFESTGIFKGPFLSGDGANILLLQYVDDALIFGEWSLGNAKNLIDVLKCYNEASGLGVNLTKSCIYGVRVNPTEVDMFARILNCKTGFLPFIYLGLPVGKSKHKVEAWSDVTSHLTFRLSSWKSKLSSISGHLTLTKPVNEARDSVMSSDSASSEVTYTSISSHGYTLAWAMDLFGLQGPDSPEAALASPDYMPGPEEPEQAPPSPDYVLGPEYPEYLAPADDKTVTEDQPYADYDGPVDYPADGGDDDNDDDSSDDDEEEASEEEEEHLALADSVIALAVDPVSSSEETEPFETDESATTPPPPPAYHTTARMSIRAQTPIPFLSEAKVDRLLAIPTPPPSPLISLSPPSVEECLARCFRAAMGRLRASSPSTHYPLHHSPPLPPLPSSLYLPPPVPTSLPLPSPPLPPLLASLFIPPPVNRREDILEAELLPYKRLCLTALTSRYKVGESSITARPTGGHRADYGFIETLDAKTRHQRAEEVGYGIRDVWVDPTEAVEEVALTTLEGVNARVTEIAEVQEEDTHDLYETVLLMEQEALVSREAWAQSVELCSAGQLSAALGQIQALQARDSTHADDPEGAHTAVTESVPADTWFTLYFIVYMGQWHICQSFTLGLILFTDCDFKLRQAMISTSDSFAEHPGYTSIVYFSP
ncbi:hypothetical protein Tco_1506002 [Tanacetum coccineum]